MQLLDSGPEQEETEIQYKRKKKSRTVYEMFKNLFCQFIADLVKTGKSC